MCGITIFFHKEKFTSEFYNRFLKSLRKIAHRGPDDEGVLLINTHTGNYKVIATDFTHSEIQNKTNITDIEIGNYNLALGHRRLSIIDLSVAGHQPMQGKDGSWIIFNGEIYNYIELREELKKTGSLFVTNSDTEVVLEAYRVWGQECWNKFNGMWAMCIWDAPNKKIILSNDRFGVKPLYYIDKKDFFVAGSETKQFSDYPDWHGGLNHHHIEEFLKYGLLDIDKRTMYNSVNRFKSSHFCYINPLNFTRIEHNQVRYYSMVKKVIPISEKDAIERFRELLTSAVSLRMRSDVKFGFALSGGIDSSAILYMARNILKEQNVLGDINGFSAIFPGYEVADESKFIHIIEKDLPCKTHYSLPMEEFTIKSFENHVYHQDEPLNGTSYFAEWSLYKKAQKNGVKILFNGQGADEVFAGYHHHFYRYCRSLLIKGKIIECLTLINSFAELKGISKKQVSKTIFNEVKLVAKIKSGIAKFDHHILKHWNEINTLDDMLLADFNTFQLPLYLRADDRDSMAFSIESRHPFMDYRLVEFGYTLPNNLLIKDGWQKYVIRKAMHEMPESIRYRKDKKGFLTPETIWLEKYKNEFEEYLNYNEKTFGKKYLASNMFSNYAIGAWLKLYNF